MIRPFEAERFLCAFFPVSSSLRIPGSRSSALILFPEGESGRTRLSIILRSGRRPVLHSVLKCCRLFAGSDCESRLGALQGNGPAGPVRALSLFSLLEADRECRLNAAPLAEDPVECFLERGRELPAQTVVLKYDAHCLFALVLHSRIPEELAHDMGKAPDLADEGIVVFLHQPPGSVLGAQGVVLVNIDLRCLVSEHLSRDLVLHPENSLFVDQVARMEHDFDPGVLFVRGQPFHIRSGKIVPQVILDLELRKYVKKRFHTLFRTSL